MGLYLFTQAHTIKSLFGGIKGYDFDVHPCDEMKKVMKNAAKGSIAYYDIGGQDASANSALYKTMLSMEGMCWGIVDPKNCEADPVMLLHAGFIDYLGKDLIQAGFPAKRFVHICEAAYKMTGCSPENADDALPFVFKPSGFNWEKIQSGTEYTFCFLYIELDTSKVVHRTQFDSGVDINPAEIFKKFVENHAESIGGSVWMWMDHLGLLLFPFDGRNCNAVYAGIRLMLDRMIFCIEESIASDLFSIKTALHIGNIDYRKRGETGEIVSDVINTVFHLGQKFTDFGDFTVSRDALSFAQQGYTKLFLYEGKYEGLQIYRLRRKS